jgi:hypothetical protein
MSRDDLISEMRFFQMERTFQDYNLFPSISLLYVRATVYVTESQNFVLQQPQSSSLVASAQAPCQSRACQ